MYLLYNLGRVSVRVNEQTRLLEIDKRREPLLYPQAAAAARQSAASDSAKYAQRAAFQPQGTRIGASGSR